MPDLDEFTYLIASLTVLVAVGAGISGRLVGSFALGLVISVTALLTLTTLLRFGRPEGFSTFLVEIVTFPSPEVGALRFETDNDTDSSDEDDYSTAIIKSYPDFPLLVTLFGIWILVGYKLFGAEFSIQLFGIFYELLGGGLLVAERIRNGPFLVTGQIPLATGLLESIWGFTLLTIGFGIQAFSFIA